MDFGALPPEINSGRMYSGAGSESMLAAASSWDGVAAQLHSAASSYESVLAGLTSGWQGPSAAAMSAAAAPYVAWMNTTAARAEQTAGQARAAAAAYETAFAAHVQPAVVATNRSQLAALVATNIFGQNTAPIAATEAAYAEMWAQDAAAMYGYAGASSAASAVTPFTDPPPTTDPGGLLSQLAAIAQTFGSSVGSSAQSSLSGFVSAVPAALQSLGSISTSPNPLQGLLSTLSSLAGMQTASSVLADVELIPKLILPANDIAITLILSLVIPGRVLSTSVPLAAAAAASNSGALAAGLGSATHVAGAAGLGAAASTVSAGTGRAGLVGSLSVPPSWAEATPTIRLAARVLQATGAGAAPVVVADSSNGLLSQMAAAGMAGAALGGAVPRVISGPAGKVGRPLSDKDKEPPDKLKRVLAEMSAKPESVQHWHTDEAQLESLLAQLSKKPGIHAVHLSARGHPTPPKSAPG
jgi:PPE-repeat protein